MKTKRGTMKKLIATLVCMAVVGTGIYVMPQTDASATESEATFQKQSYSAWKDIVPVNGSFEVGEEGMEVYGWSIAAMEKNAVLKPNGQTAAFTLETAVENGNKVAELKKGKGAGYAAMVSQSIDDISGNQDYRVEFDYKLVKVQTSDVENVGTNGWFDGFTFLVEEIDESQNSTFTAFTLGEYALKESTVWNTWTKQFKTQSTTKQVKLYFKITAGMYKEVTALVDNVSFEKHDDYAVVNAGFSKMTHEADGGRVEGTAGPTGWILETASAGGLSIDTSNTYKDDFQAVVEKNVDGRDSVAAVQNLNTEKSGRVLLQSSYVPVEGVQKCDIALDSKILCYDENGDVADDGTIGGFRITLFCYDENYTFLGRGTGTLMSVATNTKNSEEVNDWKSYYCSYVTVANTKYVTICLYVASDTTQTNDFKVYFDNVGLDVGYRQNATTTTRYAAYKSLGYEQYDLNGNGTLRNSEYFERYYGIREVDDGTGYENAVQLYKTNPAETSVGCVFFSEAQEVVAGETYQLDFDVKIEGITHTTSYGADVVLRYKNGSDEYLNSGNPTEIFGGGVENMSWGHKTYSVSIPGEAVAVEIGLVIGDTTKNNNADVTHTFANVAFEKANDTVFWTEYERFHPGLDGIVETDLLFKMLEDGNANEDAVTDVADLIRMKKHELDNTIEIQDTADMNKNQVKNVTDRLLLRWKLLGITAESQLQYVK